MNKNDNIHILFKTLTDTLPYEYNEELTNNGTTIIITKNDSDLTMYISPDEYHADDFIVAISYDNQNKGHHKKYETFYWLSEDEQIPLNTILTDIKQYL
jgi:hypothetical protein